MTDVEKFFHETWLGMVQPIEGLVVSIPALLEAQCFERHHASLQQRLLETLDADAATIPDLGRFLAEVLELTPDLVDAGEALPQELSLWVPEGHQLLAPTLGLRSLQPPEDPGEDAPPAARAGVRYELLVWDLPDGLPLDRPEDVTGEWHYPPAAKFERLLRACRVPIGLLTNRRELRLVYAPYGESAGAITFRVADIASVGGRPVLDAFVMLLSAHRWFGVAEHRRLPAILRDSRTRQADVTTALAGQVFEGLETLLSGFEAAAQRDPRYAALLDDALTAQDDHLYGGLLTVMLRLVFLLYVEDRGLVPVEDDLYAEHLSVLGLFAQLQHDAGEYPDTMSRRFGAWPRLLATFRAVFLGTDALGMPPRRGRLFDPEIYPFLEGWPRGGGAPIKLAEDRARIETPRIDDETIHRVLEKLLILDGQRLSYQELGVEQIGSVYENLMGYHVQRVLGESVPLRDTGVWVSAEEVLAVAKNQLKAWLGDEVGLGNKAAGTLAAALEAAGTDRAAALEVLRTHARKGRRATAGALVLQPGAQRRRTSSHYTPRSLTESIVRRTLEPLLATMGAAPTSELILALKVCDPAMGSGAFLVEACRFLADALVAAWTREGRLEAIAAGVDDVVNHARRLVAQKCLYGVDRNAFAVDLAKLSMWLVTLARDEPFTFLDHALRHGDSLVGLSLKQLRGFGWAPSKQLTLCAKEIEETIESSVALRQQILDLAETRGRGVTREKEWLLQSADDAMERARLLGDLVVGAFFAHDKDADRKRELTRRLGLVEAWLLDGGPPTPELSGLQEELRAQLPTFHWMLEFPEVFWAARPDPLDGGRVNKAAYMDAFIGNPPFAGKNAISAASGDNYIGWLQALHEGAHGNADLSAHFFRRAAALLGEHGAIGLIATNTIAQGDTRTTGLQPLVRAGHVIYDARVDMKWPVEGAAVTVSIAHLAVGSPVRHVTPRLDGAPVAAINSRLRPKPERPDPVALRANASLSFQGTVVLGMGFVLTPEERDAYVAADPRNAERIFPYIGGQEVNSSPTHDFDRYVISFGELSLDEAGQWPMLLDRVRERVKPERDGNNRANYRDKWWQHGEIRPGMYDAIAPLDRCLVTARVSKHLMVSFQPTDRIFTDMLYTFPLDSDAAFAVLQSRIHAPWAWLLSSSMKTDLRYSASKCFETFPLPALDDPDLESAGAQLYEERAQYMVATQQGLTDTYNLLKDPRCNDPAIVQLRLLHEAVDYAVLAAYGWSDIDVPPYGTADPATLQAFEDEVIDRLYLLNAERAEEERLLGARAAAPKARAKAAKALPKVIQPTLFGAVVDLDLRRVLEEAKAAGRLLPTDRDDAPIPYASGLSKLVTAMQRISERGSIDAVQTQLGGTARTAYRYVALGRWLGFVLKDGDAYRLTDEGTRYLHHQEERQSLFRAAVHANPLVAAALRKARTEQVTLWTAIVQLLTEHAGLSPSSAERRATDLHALILEAVQEDLEAYQLEHEQRAELAAFANLAHVATRTLAHHGPHSGAHLARALDLDGDDMSSLLDRLQALNLVQPTDDGRFAATPQGASFVELDEVTQHQIVEAA